jgi:hypothetical protein
MRTQFGRYERNLAPFPYTQAKADEQMQIRSYESRAEAWR